MALKNHSLDSIQIKILYKMPKINRQIKPFSNMMQMKAQILQIYI